jgi:hypothetical protein
MIWDALGTADAWGHGFLAQQTVEEQTARAAPKNMEDL